ncbi:MAG: UDP-2,3-diacylglucosamine diphosphatase [Alphaproteobacteria bacterium TMED89]|nr:UDP-2,3-diacylglucosamine hydrolase [Rhodospirillaceae bacterium]RPH12126.1 MAG: UDP-2,3-diacylglucosamine diphosphatase [Alphaproteobacteria bacterium TMED89]
MKAHPAFRTVFISDTHLGMTGVRHRTLLSFLEKLSCETLYLVGDIVDVWALQRHWHWSATDDACLMQVERLVKAGTRVVYIPGNHDDVVRNVLHVERFRGVELRLNDTHLLADGRRMYVTHGDQFDAVTQNMEWLSRFGHVLYEGYTAMMRQVARVPGLSWAENLPAHVKSLSKRIFQPQGAFERGLKQEASAVDAVGAIAGHIHRPALNTKEGFVYANCGDWVEACTALVEDEAGRLSLLYWSDEGLAEEKEYVA